jgi:hypothetical protein
VLVAKFGAALKSSTSYYKKALTSVIQLIEVPSLQNQDLATHLLAIAQGHGKNQDTIHNAQLVAFAQQQKGPQ